MKSVAGQQFYNTSTPLHHGAKMSVITEDSVFTSLQQHGPLAVEDKIDLSQPFSKKTKMWVKNLSQQRINATK